VMHELVQTVRSGVLHGPARTLDSVGQHDDAGLAALRLGSGVTEGRFQLHAGLAIFLLQPNRFPVKVFDQGGAVMFLNESHNRPGARRTSSCKRGCEPSPSSNKLTSVTTPKQRSTSGRIPVRINPARLPQAKLRLASRAIQATV